MENDLARIDQQMAVMLLICPFSSPIGVAMLTGSC
jgi:hypothetical protein